MPSERRAVERHGKWHGRASRRELFRLATALAAGREEILGADWDGHWRERAIQVGKLGVILLRPAVEDAAQSGSQRISRGSELEVVEEVRTALVGGYIHRD